ncbi:MAG: 6-carboxytetrahydropterin synthase, partial [Bacteroidota bacterium]|nr:6-carboxytetrahydropterin synthase [Bacteroidota bacterium]
NYEMEVKVTGIPAADTGFVIDLKLLSDIINESVIEKFDHKNLNLDVKEFSNLNPTAENIVIVIYEILREKIDKDLALQVRLYETPRNYAEYPAG